MNTETKLNAVLVPLSAIDTETHRNPRQRPAQLRKDWKNFLANVSEHGIIEPLVVGPKVNGRYPLRAGWTRFAAAKEAGFEVAPVIVNDSAATEVSLIENVHREDLHWSELAYEVASALSPVVDDTGKQIAPPRYASARDMAKALNMSDASLSNFKKLGQAPFARTALDRYISGKPVCSINQALASLKFSELAWKASVQKDPDLEKFPSSRIELFETNFRETCEGADIEAELAKVEEPEGASKDGGKKSGSSAGWNCVGGKTIAEYKTAVEKALNKGLYSDKDAAEARIVIATLRWAMQAVKKLPLAIPGETGAKPVE